MHAALLVLVSTIVGTVISAFLACLPALHAYNVLGGLVLLYGWLVSSGVAVPAEVYLPFATGMIVGWAMINTIPAVLLGAPDESAIFTVLPGQKYLMTGRGYEGTMMTGVGGLLGIFFIVFLIGPFAPFVLPLVRETLSPHIHWMLWLIIAYMFMAEWPKGGTTGVSGWAKFLDAWKSLGAGILTFLLSGFLGFIILYRSPVSIDVAFQNIMPAFVGLFAIPWCLLNILSGTEVPPQKTSDRLDVDGDVLLRSLAAGGLGGGFAAFFPVVTGGIGGMLAGQATAQRDERVFLISQGVSKCVYYVGAFVMFVVPMLTVKRGGAAWMIQGIHMPQGYYDYYMVLAAVAISGCVAFLMMSPLTRLTLWAIGRFNYRLVSVAALVIILAMVGGVTGWSGLGLMLVATGIGLIPVLYGSRRLNCLGVLLLPVACNMSGVGGTVAQWLGLL
jgi:putative membrane protein